MLTRDDGPSLNKVQVLIMHDLQMATKLTKIGSIPFWRIGNWVPGLGLLHTIRCKKEEDKSGPKQKFHINSVITTALKNIPRPATNSFPCPLM